MGAIESRLEKLEARFTPQEPPGGSARSWERYFHVVENARRELDGLEPLPDLPYTEEDREDDKSTLEKSIPVYRESPGWQTEEAKAFLDEWERDIRERLNRKDEK